MTSLADLLATYPDDNNPLPLLNRRDVAGLPFEDSDGAYWYNNFNTPLTSDEEAAYQSWLTDNAMKSGRDTGLDQMDYDGRAFWLSGQGTDSRGHSGDAGKKPNHPTFSDQSKYHGALFQGGKWGRNASFSPSVQQWERTKAWLPDYMRRVEPNSVLIAPSLADYLK